MNKSDEQVLRDYLDSKGLIEASITSLKDYRIIFWLNFPLKVKLATLNLNLVSLKGKEPPILCPISNYHLKQFRFILFNKKNVSPVIKELFEDINDLLLVDEDLDYIFNVLENHMYFSFAIGLENLVKTYWKFRSQGYAYNKTLSGEE